MCVKYYIYSRRGRSYSVKYIHMVHHVHVQHIKCLSSPPRDARGVFSQCVQTVAA